MESCKFGTSIKYGAKYLFKKLYQLRGRVLTEGKKIMRMWKAYFEELIERHQEEENDIDTENIYEQRNGI